MFRLLFKVYGAVITFEFNEIKQNEKIKSYIRNFFFFKSS